VHGDGTGARGKGEGGGGPLDSLAVEWVWSVLKRRIGGLRLRGRGMEGEWVKGEVGSGGEGGKGGKVS